MKKIALPPTGPKKPDKKIKLPAPGPKKPDKLTFEVFFSRFFPGCSQAEISPKLATAYYKNYLRSNLSFENFDTGMNY